jgi:signal transduction histidine kinase
MNPRLPRFLSAGIFILMTGLFIATFLLNQRQYTASISSVESSFNTMLDQQVKVLRNRIEQQEADQFALYNTPKALDADLYIIRPDFVVPACTAELLETLPARDTDEAFRQGIALLPSEEALPLFMKAAKRKVENSTDLYRKISAHFNILDIKYDPQTVCCILALLEYSDTKLPASQEQFFNTLLEEQVPDIKIIRQQGSRLWKMAKQIDQKLTRQKGAYRSAIDDHLLSVNEAGIGLRYLPMIQITPPLQITNSAPAELYKEIIPGQIAYIPVSMKNKAKQAIHKQYHTGNIILSLMVILGGILSGGILFFNRKQRELNAMKTKFIATVSHELRTPLSLIRLHAETLSHGRAPTDKIADYHQTILLETERLSGIVNNVLDFSRMERDKLQIHPEATNLSELTEHIVGSFKNRIAQENMEFEQGIKPDIISVIDPIAYSQIVFNLLDNAIKYSDGANSLQIELDVSDGWNILRVADLGIGIPDKLKKHIFEEFVRSDDRKVTARRGSGIGLSVAKRLAEKMGGTIEVTDNQPKGSVFTVRMKGCDETIGG